MTIKEIRDAAKVMEAYANGKKIQFLDEYNNWIDVTNPTFNWSIYIYRIKPEPKYRPFKNQEECWNEMHKHSNFGWIKGNTTGEYKQIVRIYNYKSELIFNIGYNGSADYSPEIMFSSYTFADGSPFGIKL